ncbi:glutaredoxin family protein [Methylomonas paludis]|uniref:Glutaredoxin family protein n=1 Tax=Methylomonas paludis TaxID=1173101 RepID=A0A975MN03_9GAMM|nr:glutaredoxin family protein [Methylomonas paludis]QWF70846.1 glutaredoxin family protein [Methylomonas paludis]
MMEFILIGTLGCHLCETAEQILQELGIAFEHAEIMEHPQWQTEFAWLIPVLWHQPSGLWLGWPFTAASAADFYAEHKTA